LFSEQKRFIAGAVCPKCGAIDKVVAYSKESKDYRECVACSFVDQLSVTASAPLPVTRVVKSERKDDAPAELVTLVDLKVKGKNSLS